MAVLSVINGQVQLGTAAPAVTDTFRNGILTSTTGLNRATTSAANEFCNGLPLTDAGQIQYNDATAGLPAGVQWSDGLPLSANGLCISTGPAVTYANGIPFAANGAVSAAITV